MEGSTETVSNIATAFKDLDLSVIADTILEIAPIAIAVIVPVMAIRKGISFLVSAVRGA